MCSVTVEWMDVEREIGAMSLDLQQQGAEQG